MKKLDDAKRRFGMAEKLLNSGWKTGHFDVDPSTVKFGSVPILESSEFNTRPAAPFIELPDAGNVKQLQARNLRLKMEINRLNEMLNDRDELIDQMRNPKPLKWVFAAALVGLVFLAHRYGFM